MKKQYSLAILIIILVFLGLVWTNSQKIDSEPTRQIMTETRKPGLTWTFTVNEKELATKSAGCEGTEPRDSTEINRITQLHKSLQAGDEWTLMTNPELLNDIFVGCSMYHQFVPIKKIPGGYLLLTHAGNGLSTSDHANYYFGFLSATDQTLNLAEYEIQTFFEDTDFARYEQYDNAEALMKADQIVSNRRLEMITWLHTEQFPSKNIENEYQIFLNSIAR